MCRELIIKVGKVFYYSSSLRGKDIIRKERKKDKTKINKKKSEEKKKCREVMKKSERYFTGHRR